MPLPFESFRFDLDPIEVAHSVERFDILPNLLRGEAISFFERNFGEDHRRVDFSISGDLDQLDSDLTILCKTRGGKTSQNKDK